MEKGTKRKKKLTLDEAILHCKDKVNNTPCGKDHKQLMNWLLELKNRREKEKLR